MAQKDSSRSADTPAEPPILAAKTLRQAAALLRKTPIHPTLGRERERGNLYAMLGLTATLAHLIATHQPGLCRHCTLRVLVVTDRPDQLANQLQRDALLQIPYLLGNPSQTVEIDWLVAVPDQLPSEALPPFQPGQRTGGHQRITLDALDPADAAYDVCAVLMSSTSATAVAMLETAARHLPEDQALHLLLPTSRANAAITAEIALAATSRLATPVPNRFATDEASKGKESAGRWHHTLTLPPERVIDDDPQLLPMAWRCFYAHSERVDDMYPRIPIEAALKPRDPNLRQIDAQYRMTLYPPALGAVIKGRVETIISEAQFEPEFVEFVRQPDHPILPALHRLWVLGQVSLATSDFIQHTFRSTPRHMPLPGSDPFFPKIALRTEEHAKRDDQAADNCLAKAREQWLRALSTGFATQPPPAEPAQDDGDSPTPEVATPPEPSPPEAKAAPEPAPSTAPADPLGTEEPASQAAQSGEPGPTGRPSEPKRAGPAGYSIQLQAVLGVGHQIPGAPPGDIARVTRQSFIDWINTHGRALPPDSAHLERAEVEDVDFTFSVDATADLSCWTLRYDHADRDIPGRQWKTEAVVLEREGKVTLGFRLVVLDPHRPEVLPARTVPRILRDLSARPGLDDAGLPLNGQATEATVQNIEQLLRWVERPGRNRPILVTTLPSHGNHGVNADNLARQLGPTAHVICLDARTAGWWRRRFGAEHALAPWSARLYAAGHTVDAGNQRRNDVDIRQRRDLDAVIRATLEPVVTRSLNHDDFPSLLEVRRWLYEHKLKTAPAPDQDATARLAIEEARSSALLAQTHELTQLLALADEDRRRVEQERDDAATLARTLRAQLFHLNQRQAAAPVEATAPIPLPTNFDDLEGWANTHLRGRVYILPKAATAARKSVFADPPFVYTALQALAEDYWPMRLLGDAAARDRWNTFLTQQRLRFGPTGSAVDTHATRETYQVSYGRERLPLDMHLVGSSSRKQTAQFRCYLHVHEAEQVILVGWLPSHLPNAQT